MLLIMEALDMIYSMLHSQGHILPHLHIATREGISGQRMIGIEKHAPLAAAMAGMLAPACMR
jgi:hypothetical protein